MSCKTFVLCFAALASSHAGEPTARIANGTAGLEFSPKGALASFTSADGRNLLSSDANPALWKAEIRRPGTNMPLSAMDASSFSFQTHPGKKAELRWTDFRDFPQLRVTAEVRLDRDASEWRIRMEGLEGDIPLKIEYPLIGSVAEQPGESLALPVWTGQLAHNPRKSLPGNRTFPYPGTLSMQCAALCVSNGAGIYTACDDTQNFGKVLSFNANRQSQLVFSWSHYPEATSIRNGRWSLPYSVIVSPHTGDWFSAAERYRSWATNQPWAKQSRLATQQVPEWALNTGIWVWNRGRSPDVLTPAMALKNRSGMPVSVFWHWWHGCSYDAGFPEYLPPREGAEPFKTALAKAHKQDVRALVYMNQRLWGMETSSWTNRGAERFAVKVPDGTIRPEIYNTFTQSKCASMCMGTEFWRGVYADLAERAIRALGVNGIYMDQACTSLACYDPAHGHPVGGGKYWIEGFQTLSKDIRRRTCTGADSIKIRSPKDPWYDSPLTPQTVSKTSRNRSLPQIGIALAGEGTGESWLPYLDLMLGLQVSRERYAADDGRETIPFFHAVYHPFFIPFGNYSSLTMPPYDDLWPAATAPAEPLKLLDRKYSRQFLLEQARAFVWGQQPTIANFLPEHLQNRTEEMDFVVRLAKVRARTLPYLLHGTMLPPPLASSHAAMTDFSRLSIYAGQGGGIKEFRKEADRVLATAWQGNNGRQAIALVNIGDTPATVRLRGPSGKLRLTRIDEKGSTDLGFHQGPDIETTLGPRDACVIEMNR